MACVVKEADDLLAAVDNLMVTELAGISERHRPSFRVLHDVLDADEQILNLGRLLSDCLREDDLKPVWISSLSAAYGCHVRAVSTTAGDNLIAGKNQCVTEHLHKLLVSQRQVARADDGHPSRSGLLNEKQLLSQLVDC